MSCDWRANVVGRGIHGCQNFPFFASTADVFSHSQVINFTTRNDMQMKISLPSIEEYPHQRSGGATYIAKLVYDQVNPFLIDVYGLCMFIREIPN